MRLLLRIKGFEDYAVDEFGNVFSYKYGKTRKLSQSKNTKGYTQVNLSLDGKMYPKRVHRLVAEAFIPNPCNFPEVNHIDGDKSNNSVSNLEWCDGKYNVKHSWQIGLRLNNLKACKKSILKCHEYNCKEVLMIDALSNIPLRKFKSIAEASREIFPNNDRSYVRTLITAHLRDANKGLKQVGENKVFFMFGGDEQNVNR